MTREGTRSGILGGAFAVLVGGSNFLLHGAILVSITGWGQGPRSDSERLEAGIMALAVVPILGVTLVSAMVLWLGVAAIRDARGTQSSGAAGRLMLIFGLTALVGVSAGIKSGSAIMLVVAALACLGAWLNGQAWADHRARTPRTDDETS